MSHIPKLITGKRNRKAMIGLDEWSEDRVDGGAVAGGKGSNTCACMAPWHSGGSVRVSLSIREALDPASFTYLQPLLPPPPQDPFGCVFLT